MDFAGKDIVKRLDDLLKMKNQKRKAVCDCAGIATQTITDWTKRGSIPAADTLYKIATYLETTVEHLLTGKAPADIPPDMLEIARKITALSPQDREEIMLVINHKLGRYPEAKGEAFLTKDPPPAYGYETVQKPEIKVIRPSKFDNNVTSISYDIVYTPFYGHTAAGKPVSFDIVPGMVVPWAKKMIKGDPSRYYTVQVNGDSMTEVDIKDGDYVLLRHAEAPQQNKIMLIRHGNESTLKRIKMKGDQEVYMLWEDGSGKTERLDDQDYEIQGEFMGILRG